MKCLILAGGRGERLWPLSRKNYPKQFIQIQKNHSLFQDTVARNIPYCDEFIIVTDYAYRYIVESQMAAFQGVTYRCIYEEVAKGTGVATVLACMDMQPSEMVLVAPSDHLIEADGMYPKAIIEAKGFVAEKKIVFLATSADTPDERYGWIANEGNEIIDFVENPIEDLVDRARPHLQNTGIMLFENGVLQKKLKNTSAYKELRRAYNKRTIERDYALYKAESLEHIKRASIERMICSEKDLAVVPVSFTWADIGRLEDLPLAHHQGVGPIVMEHSNSTVINECTDRAVVVNNVDDLLVINTKDAVYVGQYGMSFELKNILANNQMLSPFTEKSTIFYRSWGYYEQLCEERNYRIRRVILYPGKTIYAHSHFHRSENWTIVQGNVKITLDSKSGCYGLGDSIRILPGMVHQISNNGSDDAVFVETACGEIIREKDIVGQKTEDLGENQLGIENEPFVKLKPAFKDYLWGGRKLRDLYDKKCDYQIIAESWELSAHPSGQSVVASGKHKGMLFTKYLETVGKDVLGWKCRSSSEFPLLIKFIDAKENLSIQVHPDDDYALEHEHQYGKNEMWYVVDCEPGSSLFVGFNKDMSKKEILRRIEDNTIVEVLNQVQTHPGDVFFIPAGTVHAIGAGNLICEIQQSSNCTYRLYDYARRDAYGNLRELHLQKAMDVLDYSKYFPQEYRCESLSCGSTLASCKYFESTVYEVKDVLTVGTDDSRFLSIVCLDGWGRISSGAYSEEIRSGDSFFVRAKHGQLQIKGSLRIIITHI